MFSLRSYLASVFAVLFISSCASRPELVPVLKPELGQMSAEVELNGVLLMAEIDSDAEALSAYGFLYGKSETSMKKVQGQLNDGVLSVKLDGLEYDTDYFYKVFVSNGHSQIYSEILKFRTSEEPYLTLSETSVTISSEGGIFYVDVSANIDFDIMIPDDEWISYVRDENRVTFTVSENPAISRECEVVFARTERTGNMAITAGFIAATCRWMAAYAGAGYGWRCLQWQDIDGNWAEVSDFSFRGLAVEAGLLFSYRRMAFSAGLSTISFKTASFTIGVGLLL